VAVLKWVAVFSHPVGVDWSWVETLAEVEEAREHARRLIGLRLAAVRYASLDYFLWDRPMAHADHGW
jgi:hypothetical protein